MNSLPKEILSIIAGFLPPRNILRFFRVCKRLQSLDKEEFWKQLSPQKSKPKQKTWKWFVFAQLPVKSCKGVGTFTNQECRYMGDLSGGFIIYYRESLRKPLYI